MKTLLVLFVLAAAASAPAADRYVAQGGQTPDPGGQFTNWMAAASNIGDAVNAALAGETVWVSNGVYSSTEVNSTVVSINRSVSLRGVSANRAAVVINGSDTNRGIYIAASTSAFVLIENITITNCRTPSYGGGVRLAFAGVNSGTAIIHNCAISGNNVSLGNPGYGGGGLYSRGSVGSGFLLLMTNCLISGNTTFGRDGGGALRLEGGRFEMWDCIVRNNRVLTDVYGGALKYLDLTQGSLICNSWIVNNYSSGRGGGICGVGNMLIESCVCCSNESPTYGGGLYNGGGTNLIIRNSLFAYNTGQRGGGMALYDGSNILVDCCTIASNLSTATGVSPGGIWIRGDAHIRNSIIHKNTGATANLRVGDTTNPRETFATLTNCCTSSTNVAIAGTTLLVSNVITDDPQFLDITNCNFRLAKDSPCINAGTNQNWMGGTRDLDKRQRIRYGIVDIGCYEITFGGTIYMVY